MRIANDLDSDGVSKTFVGCHVVGGAASIQAVFAGRNSHLYGIERLDLDALDEALAGSDFPRLKAIQDDVHFTSTKLTEEADALVSYSGRASMVASENWLAKVDFAGGSEGGLAQPHLHSTLPFDAEVIASAGLVKVDSARVSCRHLVFCLDSSGALFTVCAVTMLAFDVWQEATVLDFVLMEDHGDGGQHRLKILLSVREEDGTFRMQMREYPGFELLYELDVAAFLCLLECSPNQEMPLLMEGSCANAGNENVPPPPPPQGNNAAANDLVQYLRVRGICESVPEARLDRLVRRQRFDEAEKFAKDFKLPAEQVHRGRIAWILERLSPWRKERLDGSEEEQLIRTLGETLRKVK